MAVSLAAFQPSPAFRLGDDRPPNLAEITADWDTDWSIHSIDLREIQSGGVPRNAIPALDHPATESIGEAATWLDDREPVIAVFVGSEARAYPLQVLTWHEIANDEIGGVPVAVTFCPLCNAALVFDRRVHGEVVDFGVSGLLRHSDLIMYDRQTQSLWQQLEGTAVVGALTGTPLRLMASLLVSWSDFKAAFPNGDVLSRPTERARAYGANPYEGYDQTRPFLFRGDPDPRLSPTERVVAVENGGNVAAYPFNALKAAGTVNDDVGGRPIVVFWKEGLASALDTAEISRGRDVGSAGVFDRRTELLISAPTAVDPITLTFTLSSDRTFVDVETGSTWSIFGRAVAGPLSGAELQLVPHGTQFWFAWAAFRPETRVWSARDP